MRTLDRRPVITKGLTLVLLLGTLGWIGCSGSDVPVDLKNDIPGGADRVIIERAGPNEMVLSDAPALGYYVDTRQYLEDSGYGIASADEENLILVTEPGGGRSGAPNHRQCGADRRRQPGDSQGRLGSHGRCDQLAGGGMDRG